MTQDELDAAVRHEIAEQLPMIVERVAETMLAAFDEIVTGTVQSTELTRHVLSKIQVDVAAQLTDHRPAMIPPEK